MMRRMQADLVLELVDVTKATILEESYNMLMRVSKNTEAAAAGAAQSKDKPAKGITSPKQGPEVIDQRGFHLGGRHEWWWGQV